jgi:hypothetical protein
MIYKDAQTKCFSQHRTMLSHAITYLTHQYILPHLLPFSHTPVWHLSLKTRTATAEWEKRMNINFAVSLQFGFETYERQFSHDNFAWNLFGQLGPTESPIRRLDLADCNVCLWELRSTREEVAAKARCVFWGVHNTANLPLRLLTVDQLLWWLPSRWAGIIMQYS